MWKDLKQAETKAMAERATGQPKTSTITKLRTLLEAVKDEPDADMAICYHGASALVCEAEGRLEDAIRHREIEIDKILWLQGSMQGSAPEDAAFALQDYGEADLARRRDLLASLRQALGDPGP